MRKFLFIICILSTIFIYAGCSKSCEPPLELGYSTLLGFGKYPKKVFGINNVGFCGYLGGSRYAFYDNSSDSCIIKVYNIETANVEKEITLQQGFGVMRMEMKVSLKPTSKIVLTKEISKTNLEIYLFDVNTEEYSKIYTLDTTGVTIPEDDVKLIDCDITKELLLLYVWMYSKGYYYLISNTNLVQVAENISPGAFIGSNGRIENLKDNDIWYLDEETVKTNTHSKCLSPFVRRLATYDISSLVLKNEKRGIKIILQDTDEMERKIVSFLDSYSGEHTIIRLYRSSLPPLELYSPPFPSFQPFWDQSNKSIILFASKHDVWPEEEENFLNKWVLIDISSKIDGIIP